MLGSSENGEASSDSDAGQNGMANQAESRASRDLDGSAGQINGVKYTFHTKEEPDSNRPFAQGFIDGIDSVDQKPFESFLELKTKQEHLQSRLENLLKEEQEIRSDLNDRVELESNLQRYEKELEEKEARVDESREEMERLEQKVDEKEANPPQSTSGSNTEENDAPERGSLVYTLLYSAAGLLFVAGDVIMSREVVAKALRLTDPVEAWTFAVGLAMLAVLMKPAYDRLVEKPYWNGNHKAFRWTIMLGVLAAALTLGVLGAFRSEAFQSRQKIERLQNELTEGQRAGSISQERVSEIQSRISSLQQSTTDSLLGELSFLLSGVLFAAAGAVCLGIGLRHGRDWYHRSIRPLFVSKVSQWKYNRERSQLRSEREKAKQDFQERRQERNSLSSKIQEVEKKLELEKSVDELRDQLQEIRDEQDDIRSSMPETESTARIDAYRNGYELAEEGLTQSNGQSDGLSQPGYSDADTPGASSENDASEEDSQPRPFLAVRNAIARDNVQQSS